MNLPDIIETGFQKFFSNAIQDIVFTHCSVILMDANLNYEFLKIMLVSWKAGNTLSLSLNKTPSSS